MWRTASGIFSGVSFQGYMLTCELGASIATSIATASTETAVRVLRCMTFAAARFAIGKWSDLRTWPVPMTLD